MRGTGIFSVVLCLVIFPRFLSGNSDPWLVPALYVLGDSLLDSGNNNFLPTLARADFKPYGVNFPGGATGRFTNGRTVADFIAEFLGLPMSPPFMSFRNSQRLTGLNYASGSCGILPETGNYIGKCLNLDDQIGLFGKTVKNGLTKHLGSSEVLSDYLSKSIFLVSTGNNDYINNYLQPNLYDSSSRYSPHSFAQLLTDSLSHKLEGMEGMVKKYQQKFRKVKDEMSRWDELQSRLLSQFRNASSIIERLQLIQNPKNYGALKCVGSIEDTVLRKQMESWENILLSMDKTMKEFHSIVLFLEKTLRDGRQLVKGGSVQATLKQLQQQIGIKPCLADCLDGLSHVYEMHQSEYLLKSSIVSALPVLALKPSGSDLGALQQLLVDQPNIPREEVGIDHEVQEPSSSFCLLPGKEYRCN